MPNPILVGDAVEAQPLDSGPTWEKVKLENSDQILHAHLPGVCAGERCTIHNMSDHHMRSWPQIYLFEYKLMFRKCEHKEYHPDPDDYNWYTGTTTYLHKACCGCCLGIEIQDAKPIRFI